MSVLRMPRSQKPILSYACHMPGGAVFGLLSIAKAIHIEQESGLRLADLFDIFLADSVGATMAAAIATRHPDDPERSRYTMEEFEEKFRHYLPQFLAYDRWHYARHAFNFVSGAIGIPPIRMHYDQACMEKSLRECFGDAMIGDSLRSIVITSQKIHPAPIQPFDFTYLDPALLKDGAQIEKLHPKTPVPLYKAVTAACACPNVYQSYSIEETGTNHVDIAQAETGATRTMMRIKNNLREDRQLAYVRLGTGEYLSDIDPMRYNRMDVFNLFQTQTLNDLLSSQVQARNRLMIQELLGEENAFFLNEPLGELAHIGPADTRPKTIDDITAFARESIDAQKDVYKRLIDELGDNYNRKHTSNPDSAFGMRRYFPSDGGPLLLQPAHPRRPSGAGPLRRASLS